MMWSHHQLPLPLLGGMYQHVLGINSLIGAMAFLVAMSNMRSVCPAAIDLEHCSQTRKIAA